jgi:hypothetical protein
VQSYFIDDNCVKGNNRKEREEGKNEAQRRNTDFLCAAMRPGLAGIVLVFNLGHSKIMLLRSQ